MPGDLPCLSRLSGDYAGVWTACANNGGLSPMREILNRSSMDCARVLMERVNAGGVLVFPLHHVLWMPNFQFDTQGALVEGIEGAINELKFIMDMTAITLWFCAPCMHLGKFAPMRLLGTEPLAVVRAARVHRLVEQKGS